jgi:hypothetical protein
MNADQLLRELILLLSHSTDTSLVIPASAAGEWPHGLLPELSKAGLIRKAEPARSVICTGCHHACSMEVFSDKHGKTGAMRHFVVCDRRDDIGLVPLTGADLEQLQLSLNQLVKFLKTELPLMPTAKAASGGLIPLGRIEADHGPRLVAISTDQSLDLAIGHERLPIVELIFFRDGRLKIDVDEVQRLADRDENAGHEFAVSSTRNQQKRKAETADRRRFWNAKYRELKRAHPEWSDEAIAATIAENDPYPGKRETGTVRRYMK